MAPRGSAMPCDVISRAKQFKSGRHRVLKPLRFLASFCQSEQPLVVVQRFEWICSERVFGDAFPSAGSLNVEESQLQRLSIFSCARGPGSYGSRQPRTSPYTEAP